MSDNARFDILVAGSGPTGKTAALALAKQGFQVALVAPVAHQGDQRTTALMVPSVRFLTELGIWEKVEQSAAPLRAMRIIDATSRLLRARPVTFNATEIDEEAFGWNIPNAILGAALDEQIKATQTITCFHQSISHYQISETEITATLATGTAISASLVAGADGRNSLARSCAGIKLTQWDYPQSAVVTAFEHARPHENMSSEFHTESGPCVQVPLPGNQSSLVWVVAPSKAEELKSMTDFDFSLAIEMQMHSILGKVKVYAPRQIFPLSGHYPDKFGHDRIALLGEAAHLFPPIGAQGLNLGLRDVVDLSAATLGNPVDPGASEVMAAYDRARRPDIMARTGAVHALNRSLLSDMLPVQLARTIGTALIDQAAPLRGLFMREGMQPGAGIRSILETVFRPQRQDDA